MVKMVTHTEARHSEISKLKNILEKPSNPPEVTGITKLKNQLIFYKVKRFKWSSCKAVFL